MNILNSNGALLAIETNDEDMLRMILSKTDIPFGVRINDAYLEEWTLLEFALMLGHRHCAEVLLQSGATINVELYPLERRLQQVQENAQLITEEIRFLWITNVQNEDKHIKYLERRLSQMEKMKAVLKNAFVPGPPNDVEAVVSASDQLTVTWKDVHQHNVDLIINYKIEWSLCDDFNSIEGSLLVDTVLRNYAVISDLKRGLRYSVRVSAASIGGFGHPTLATPHSLLISMFPKSSGISDKKKRRNIRSLFVSGFQSLKVIQRGIYLVSIIYSQMKVCTVEDCLPVILVDQTQFCIEKNEMYWAIKLSLAWGEIQTLQEANNSSSPNFRSKFIDAAIEMHTALRVKDIGRVYYQPIVDEINSISFIVTVRFVNGSQNAQGLTTKWLPLSKIVRKRGACRAMDVLLAEIFKIINFFESSHVRLRRGLYIYNPHITKEEWDLLRSVDIKVSNSLTPVQFVFYTALVKAASRLLIDLEIDINFMPNQRIYRLQVFQPQFDVSFIILLPKIEDVCTVRSYSLISSVQKGCFTLPLQVFEAIHLCTYNPDFIGTYCRLSVFIEHFSTYIQYEQRNSLLEKDINIYADVLSKLDEFRHRLESTWKSVRWIGDVASIARDKRTKGVVSMKRLFAVSNGMNDEVRHNEQGTTSDKQIAPTTTASEIVALVTERLAKAATESGKRFESKDPEDFCLTVVVGSRERRLRDDFPLMKLQNPWGDGRLFVRRRDSVLAALQRGNETAV
ncbi:Uncharacterized protein BM_BM5275 [Brugia malayi]|uniref:Ankyrin repeat and fibronectin type-III domain-containing protein 1 n=1 Tax=Brugia malayi TaxID=6279 RepID=A0A4E9ERB5_BRUMA|nr:Uncharacterized protein BM_BM5275 [Brugia malayi]VIO86689.1 Uncharacterized protein BM_BM5275 [Brugia malayi]